MSLDYKIYKELGKSYLNDIRKGIKNLSYKTILPLTLASTMALYACGGGSSGGGSSGGGGNPAIYQCNDRNDNDGDVLVDMLDPGCSSLTDDKENRVPIADAAFLQSYPPNDNHPDYVHPGDIVQLDGTGSCDPDDVSCSTSSLDYLWNFVSVPDCSTKTDSDISNISTAVPYFTPDCIGNYTLELTVSDGLDTGSDTVVQSVVDNNPPVADAGNDSFGVIAGITNVNLNGSGISDTDGAIVFCEWDYEGDGTYDWSSSSTCSTTHIYPSPGNFNAKLRVTDDDGAQNIDTKFVEVN